MVSATLLLFFFFAFKLLLLLLLLDVTYFDVSFEYAQFLIAPGEFDLDFHFK